MSHRMRNLLTLFPWTKVSNAAPRTSCHCKEKGFEHSEKRGIVMNAESVTKGLNDMIHDVIYDIAHDHMTGHVFMIELLTAAWTWTHLNIINRNHVEVGSHQARCRIRQWKDQHLQQYADCLCCTLLYEKCKRNKVDLIGQSSLLVVTVAVIRLFCSYLVINQSVGHADFFLIAATCLGDAWKLLPWLIYFRWVRWDERWTQTVRVHNNDWLVKHYNNFMWTVDYNCPHSNSLI